MDSGLATQPERTIQNNIRDPDLMAQKKELKTVIAQKRALLKPLDLFDANVWLGKPQEFPWAHPIPPHELHKTLKTYEIKGACISHWLSKTASPQEANVALVETAEILTKDEFLIYTALPLFPAEPDPLPGPNVTLPKLRGVRIFPCTHGFSPMPWVLDTLLQWLGDKRIPLFVWHTEIGWSDLYALAQAFPNLDIVVESQPQKLIYHTRSVFALMKSCPNVYLEISNLVAPGLLSYAVDKLGAHRLLFGSFLPVSDPFVPISLLVEAPISQQDKRSIAGGNLRRMLETVTC